MRDQDIKSLCKKLKPVMGQRADALWATYATAETPQSRQEAEALINLLATQYLSANIGDEPILLPPPSPEAAAGEFLLGTIFYGKKPVGPLFLREQKHSLPRRGLEKVVSPASFPAVAQGKGYPGLFGGPKRSHPLPLESVARSARRSSQDLDQCRGRGIGKIPSLGSRCGGRSDRNPGQKV